MPDYIRISEAQNQTFADNLQDLINMVEGARIEYDPSEFNACYTIVDEDEDADVRYISTASSSMYNDWITRHRSYDFLAYRAPVPSAPFYEAAHSTHKECVLDEDVLNEGTNNELDDFLAEFAPKGAT